MKIPKINTKRNIAIYAIVAIILLALSAFAYVYVFNGNLFGWIANHKDNANQDSSIDLNEPTDDQKKAGNIAKDATVNDKQSEGSDPLPDPTPQPSGKSQVAVAITSSSQNGDVLQIRSLISTIDSSGTCTLQLVQDDKTVTKTAKVQPLASSSTCQGFDLPVSELAPGSWRLSLTYESSHLIGETSQNVTIH